MCDGGFVLLKCVGKSVFGDVGVYVGGGSVFIWGMWKLIWDFIIFW